MPTSDSVVKMLRADLLDARSRWVDETSEEKEREIRKNTTFLDYRDEAGRVIDFHAL